MTTVSTTAESSSRPRSLPRLLHLQILRAVAAALVVVDHSILTLNDVGVLSPLYTMPAFIIGHIGVAAFFAVSGLIMMRQSSDQFGLSGSPLRFAWHRVIRIVPLYWLATLLRYYSRLMWHAPTPHSRLQLLLSLSFVPNFRSEMPGMMPILDVGWTLNYEMGFYLLFTLCLFFRRNIGVLLLILVPVLLSQLHELADLALAMDSVDHPFRALWAFFTEPMIVLFAFGVFIGYLELKAVHSRRSSLSVSPALLLVVAVILILAHPAGITWLRYWKQTAWFGAVCAMLCTVVTLDKPGWLNRLLVLLGDASYSTYLFHLWVVGWLIPPLMDLPALHRSRTAPILAILLSLFVANLAGLIIHLVVERPLTRALRRINFPPHANSNPTPMLNSV